MRAAGLMAFLVAVALAGQPASAAVITGKNFQVSFGGSVTPTKLPRIGSGPISVGFRGAVQELPGPPPPPLREIVVSINRHVRLSLRGLMICPRHVIRDDTSRQALARCRKALVGSGYFTAHIKVPEQAPFPAKGHLLVFNSRWHGHRALLGHIYGTQPIPTVLDLYFRLHRETEGPFGWTLAATMPEVGNEWGYVTGFEVDLGRRYLARGRRRSVLTAGCPAPAGFPGATFKVARGAFDFADGTSLSRTLTGVCHVAAADAAGRRRR